VALDSYFVERRNQFQKSTLQKLVRGNPFRSLVPMSAFDLSEGRTPTVRTLTHELPTAYPTAMEEVVVSDNSGVTMCQPTATTIKRGEVHRTFKLYQASFDTDTVCLSDLKRAEQMANAAAAFERALNEYLQVWWSDWYRIQNIAMAGNKVATLATDGLNVVESTKSDFTDLGAVPTTDLGWGHLRKIYWQLVRNGAADELAIGRDSKGRPILPLCAGPAILAALWKDDTHVKEQVKFFDSAQNLKVLGYDGAIDGFLPVVDLFPIRFGKGTAADQSDNITLVSELVAANMIYPTVNAAATSGRKHSPNAAYEVGVAGSATPRAKFEVVTILGKSVYEAKYEAVDPSSFSGMNFKPQNYVGEFRWVNNPTFRGTNDRQNLGYYLADVRCGAKPLFPELGYSIVTKARDI
jgi:hypothetical protein